MYIKRKIWVCSAKKCKLCFGSKSPLRRTDLQRTRFHAARIGTTVQICGNSGLAIAMVRCLHQWNVYIKRKLRVCSAQKCKPCFGAKSPLRSTDCKKNGSIQRCIGPKVQICVNSGRAIAMVPCLHQCNVCIKR